MMARERAAAVLFRTRTDPGGISKRGPKWRSVVRAWRIVRLLWAAIGVAKNMAVDHNGNTLIRVFRSSTSPTVHNLQFFSIDPSDLMSPSVFKAARLKNLTKGQRNVIFFH